MNFEVIRKFLINTVFQDLGILEKEESKVSVSELRRLWNDSNSSILLNYSTCSNSSEDELDNLMHTFVLRREDNSFVLADTPGKKITLLCDEKGIIYEKHDEYSEEMDTIFNCAFDFNSFEFGYSISKGEDFDYYSYVDLIRNLFDDSEILEHAIKNSWAYLKCNLSDDNCTSRSFEITDDNKFLYSGVYVMPNKCRLTIKCENDMVFALPVDDENIESYDNKLLLRDLSVLANNGYDMSLLPEELKKLISKSTVIGKCKKYVPREK